MTVFTLLQVCVSAGLAALFLNKKAAFIEHARIGAFASRGYIECDICIGKDSDARNMSAFHAPHEKKADIEQAFGGELDWQELPTCMGCPICMEIDGGWKTQESDWPARQDWLLVPMMKLQSALKGPIEALKI